MTKQRPETPQTHLSPPAAASGKVRPIRSARRRPGSVSLQRLAGEQPGFSLVELMVTVSLLIVVLTAILGLLDVTVRLAPKDEERTQVVREAQVGLARMVRELRQAHAVGSASGSFMDVTVVAAGAERHVRYQCDVANPADALTTRCVRREGAPGGDLSAATAGDEVVVDRVLNGAAVFTPPSGLRPDYAEAKVRVPARGELSKGYEYSLVLDDGFHLRNLGAGSDA